MSQKKEESNGSGNPGKKGLVEWPAWDKAGDRYLYIAETIEVKSGHSDLTKIQPIRIGISLKGVAERGGFEPPIPVLPV
jgi:hypothetical protein